MKEIIIGISLIYTISSVTYFWKIIIEEERKKNDKRTNDNRIL